MSPADAVHDPHFVERGTVRTVTDPYLGPFSVPGFPIKFDGAILEPPLATAALGEHNEPVLSELLGWSSEQVAEALDDGVLVRADR